MADTDHQYIQENHIFYFMTVLVRFLSGYIFNGIDYEWFCVAGPNASNTFFCMSASHPSTQPSHLQCRVTPPTPTLWPLQPLRTSTHAIIHTHTHMSAHVHLATRNRHLFRILLFRLLPPWWDSEIPPVCMSVCVCVCVRTPELSEGDIYMQTHPSPNIDVNVKTEPCKDETYGSSPSGSHVLNVFAV